jgi:arylsulfatase A-like enzyme
MSGPSLSRRGLLAGAISTGLIAGARPARAAADRRAVLLITTDQQSGRCLGASPHSSTRTPHIDSLAQGGSLFLRSWTADPTCCPARAAWALGRPGSETGVVLNPLAARADLPTLGGWLRAQGVRPVLLGKWHVPGHAPHRTFEVGSPSPMQAETGDLLQVRLARQFLREQSPDAPFLLWVSLLGPHDICQATALAGVSEDAAAAGLEGQALPPAPPNLHDRGDESAVFRSVRRRGLWERWEAHRWRQLRAWTDRMTGAVDVHVGALLKALEDSPHAAHTTVVFTSDHGDNLGEHGLAFKESPYEAALSVPFAVRGPGAPLGRGIDPHTLVAGVDLFPTVCDLLGVAPPPGLPGRALGPLLRGEVRSHHEAIFAEVLVEGRAVRVGDHKLIRFRGEPDRGQLFDLAADPFERQNLFESSAHQGIREELTARLDAREAGLDLHPRARLSWAEAHAEVGQGGGHG